MFEAKLKVGDIYSICTGNVERRAIFKGVAGQFGERLLVFEREDAAENEHCFIGARIELHIPYRTEPTTKITGQLYGTHYGPSIDELRRNGLPEAKWELI